MNPDLVFYFIQTNFLNLLTQAVSCSFFFFLLILTIQINFNIYFVKDNLITIPIKMYTIIKDCVQKNIKK